MPYRLDPNTGQFVWDGSSIPQTTRDSLGTQIRDLQAQIDALSFIDLDDVPTTYTGQSGKILSVKSTEDGLEFVTNSGGGSGVTDGDKGDVIVSSSGTVWTLDTTAVTAGSYTLLGATIDAKGRVTAASSGTISASTISDSTTVGQNIIKLTNPGAVTFLRMNADNTVSALNAADMLTALGAYAASNPSGYTTNTGTVTSVSVTTANGISGTVATATSTPAITLSLGAITPSSVNGVAISGSSTPTLAVTGTTAVSGTNTGNVSLAASLTDILALSGQQLQGVTDGGSDQILFFDQSATKYTFLTVGTGLSISGTTITATFSAASPGAIGGTTPSTAVFTQVDVRTELDIQSTSGTAGPIQSWNTPTTELTNWERAKLAWSSNVFTLSTERNGTGVARDIDINPGGVATAKFRTAGRLSLRGANDTSGSTLNVKAEYVGGSFIPTVRIERHDSTASIAEIGMTSSANGYIRLLTASGTVELQGALSIFPQAVSVGLTTNSARHHIRGSGTTTNVTLLVENSAGTARFTVRDDGAFAFAGGTVAVAETGWTTFTNLTTDRTCDANATTVEELADILGTLIEALKAKGIISA